MNDALYDLLLSRPRRLLPFFDVEESPRLSSGITTTFSGTVDVLDSSGLWDSATKSIGSCCGPGSSIFSRAVESLEFSPELLWAMILGKELLDGLKMIDKGCSGLKIISETASDYISDGL